MLKGRESLRVLMAVGEPNLSAILRKHLLNNSFDVIDNEVFHRSYIQEFLDTEHPNIIIIHDGYLESDFEVNEDKEKEMLDMIERWRVQYNNDLRVVYLCERDNSDPFLGGLVARNVLDIFNQREINAATFNEQLMNPPLFSNVKRIKVGNYELEREEEVSENTELPEQVNQPEAGDKAKELLSKMNRFNLKATISKVPRPSFKIKKTSDTTVAEKKEEVLRDIELDDVIDLSPVPIKQYSQVLGTVVIAVGGLMPHLGATQSAVSIASFLKKKDYSVALIEANLSEDFDRIHALYEGEKKPLSKEDFFELNGIDHYKFRENMRLGEIASLYQYVVLDIGEIQTTPYFDEFMRAHVRCVVTSPFEWKQHWLEDFAKRVSEPTDFCYVLPLALPANVKDMEERFGDYTFVGYPALSNPYATNDEVNNACSEVLQGFLNQDPKGFSKKNIIATSLISIAITLIVVSTLQFL